MLHLRDMAPYIIGHFESQQKDTFCQGNLHGDKDFKWKNGQQGVVVHILRFLKSPRSSSCDKN